MLLRPQAFRAAKPFFHSTVSAYRAMPLKAKINAAALSSERHMSSIAEEFQPQPGDEPDDVLFNTIYGLRTIELNRPKKLNSLNGSMARKIVPRLQEWAKSDMANVIIMKGAGERALCAGGDVAVLAQWNQEGEEGQRRSKEYFGLEYKLDHLIATYPKPYVAFMDGFTMGGGVGLSLHAPFRIATERTNFAMPETDIGFFPEVGGSFFLPRLDGALGTYLALTSERLTGVNTFYQGIATHYIDSSSLPDLEARLAELTFKDYTTYEQRLRIINSTITEFETGLPHDKPIHPDSALRAAIDRCFAHDSIAAILDSLKKEGSEWGSKTLKTIAARSPTSLKVTLRQMQLGGTWSIDTAFQREYHIAAKFMEEHDFVEGVTAKLIRKPATKPEWKPATLDEVTDDVVDNYFRIPQGERRLALLSSGPRSNYEAYPHAWTSLPTETDVMAVVKKGGRTRKAVVQELLQMRDGKLGIKERVEEILQRKTRVQDGNAAWLD